MNITFIAPPAAGKGTLGLKVSQKYGIPHISTGDLLRSSEDERIKRFLDEGKFVDDSLIAELTEKRLSEADCDNGFVLDGFPRNLKQAIMYDELLERLNKDKGIAIVIDLDKDIAAKRILGRRICPDCGAVYNVHFDAMKPKVLGVCDNCNGKLTSRIDDNIETFENRYQVYMNETYPLIKYYEDKDMAYHIEALDDANDTFNQIVDLLGGLYDNN